MTYVARFEEEILQWPNVSAHPHRFGGREFRFGKTEIGHIHIGGILDIPFPRSLHDVLLRDGLAEEHRWVPDSGWITAHFRNDEELKHAVWLMEFSYLRYALKTATNARTMLDKRAAELHLSSEFKSLLEPFVPKSMPVEVE
jgi:luciferase-like monooxygenase